MRISGDCAVSEPAMSGNLWHQKSALSFASSFLLFCCSDQLLFLLLTFPYFLSFFFPTILALILLIPSCSCSARASDSLTLSPGRLLHWKASKLSRTLPRLVRPAPDCLASSRYQSTSSSSSLIMINDIEPLRSWWTGSS